MSDSKPTPGASPTPWASGSGGWPFTDATKNFPEAQTPALKMVNSDLNLMCRWGVPQQPQWKGPPFKVPQQTVAPWQPMGVPAAETGAGKPVQLSPQEMEDLRSYILGVPANKVVPPPQTEEKKEDGAKTTWSFGQVSRKTEGTGVKSENERTRTRSFFGDIPDTDQKGGKTTHDSEWAGKWKEKEWDIVKFETKSAEAKAEVAGGKFGDADSFFSGSGSVLGAGAQAKASGSITSKGIKGEAGGEADAYLMKGEVKGGEKEVVGGSLEGSVGRANAEAKGEIALTAEEATLGGKLALAANIAEGKGKLEGKLTPTRISRAFVSGWNWAFGTDLKPLSDDWDFGIVMEAEGSVAVGAQAEAEANAGFKDGDLRAKAGLKLGLGVGAGVKVGGGLTGLDKIKKLIWD